MNNFYEYKAPLNSLVVSAMSPPFVSKAQTLVESKSTRGI